MITRRESGFSITEVLVTLFVLSVGMMGASQVLIDAKSIQQATIGYEHTTQMAMRVVEMARAVEGKVSAAEFKSMAEAKIRQEKQNLDATHILSRLQCTVELIPENAFAVLLRMIPNSPSQAERPRLEWTIDL